MIFPASTVLDLGAMAWLAVVGYQVSSSHGIGEEWQTAAAVCTVALAIFAIVYGVGRFVERFQMRGISNQSKLVNDDRRIENIEKIVVGIEKDLIGRRAIVDKEISHHAWQLDAFERRMLVIESRHNRLRDKFNVVVGSLAPVLKDMDADFTRNGVMGKVFQAIEENEPTSEDGSQH